MRSYKGKAGGGSLRFFHFFGFATFLGVLANTAFAQNAYRSVQMPPNFVYIENPVRATGFGIEINVNIANISDMPQNVRVSLYNENLRIVAFVSQPSTTFFQLGGAPNQWDWQTAGTCPGCMAQADFPSTTHPTKYMIDAARSSALGKVVGLQPNTTATWVTVAAGQTAKYVIWAVCEYGDTINCQNTVPGGDLNNKTYFTARGTPERNPSSDCIFPPTLDADGSGPLLAGQAPPNWLCKLEVNYTYGIKVEVQDTRGAVVGSVAHRSFPLGGGASRIDLQSASYPLNGGRAF
jgi:hypothetical protein